jgi:hypothetical protein
MARRTVPLIGPIVPVKGRPGVAPGNGAPSGRKVLVPANAAAARARGGAGGRGKRVVPVPAADAAVVVPARTRRPVPPPPPPPTSKQPPGPAARRTAMQALKAGKVAF